MSEFEDIQRLLRLKRYETPGENYVEQTLQAFHRRQAAALIHRPLWRLALDRFHAHTSSGFGGQLAFATGAAVLCLAAIALLGPRLGSTLSGLTARNDAQPQGVIRLGLDTTPVAYPPQAPSSFNPKATLTAQNPDLEFIWLLAGQQNSAKPLATPAPNVRPTESPRYVLDARPVSYDASLSF